MNTQVHDYSEYQERPAEAMFQQLEALVDQQLRAEQAVEAAEQALGVAKEKLRQLSEVQIPAHLDQMKMQDFTRQDGLKVKIQEKVYASLPKDRAAAGCTWLAAHGAQHLIKTQVKVEFAAGDAKKAAKLADSLRKRKNALEAEMAVTVNPQSLAAWVRSQLEEGAEVDLDLLGVHRKRVSVVELPKAKKKATGPDF